MSRNAVGGGCSRCPSSFADMTYMNEPVCLRCAWEIEDSGEIGERVLVCGSRDWTHERVLYDVLDRVHQSRGIVAVIHGAYRGADSMAKAWAEECPPTVKEVPFPADWKAHGKKAGPLRNRRMLNEGRPTLVLAFHDDLASSRGTGDMVEIALAAGLPVYQVDSCGVVRALHKNAGNGRP